MFDDLLDKYKIKGSFTLKPIESLEEKCNAPFDKSGVYIGSSGQKKDGKLKTRKSRLGGMRDRLVNGYHPKFGKVKRKNAFPTQMKTENIPEIKIKWWVTYDNEFTDFPTDVETVLKEMYIEKYGNLPDWHK